MLRLKTVPDGQISGVSRALTDYLTDVLGTNVTFPSERVYESKTDSVLQQFYGFAGDTGVLTWENSD